MEWLIQAAQLILSLSILVVLHELGHFVPAKLFKTKVEKFYLFFDPWFSLIKFKKGETEYGVGWLPLGGYVKIAGMIDESMDKEQLDKPAEPWEFRSKPAWQRLIIMLGGVTVNAILGVLIYAMILFTWGSNYIPAQNLANGIYCDSLALGFGLQHGDQIVSVDGQEVEKLSAVTKEIILNEASSIQIIRAGRPMDIAIPSDLTASILKKGNPDLIQPAYLPIVIEVQNGTPAEDAGLQKGDQIMAVNDQPTPYFQGLVQYLKSHKAQDVQLTIDRDGNEQILKAKVRDNGTLGFAIVPPSEQLTYKTEEYGFLASFPAGYNRAVETFADYLKQFKLIFNPETEAYKSLGGFITIGKAFSPTWNWLRFWEFTAFLSIVLAIMNLLPIPALDGGHVMFLSYEMITKRKPHEKVMEYAQVAGMIFLFALLLFANGNDIVKLFQ